MHAFAIETPADLDRALEVRFEVFVEEQGVAADAERDHLDADPRTLHVLVVDGEGAAVATGRLLAPHTDSFHEEGVHGEGVHGATDHTITGHGNMDPSTPHIGRVAVLGRARGSGAGRAVMEFLEAAALERFGASGVVRVELSAQDQAMPFYERLGYTGHGDGYLDEGIWHHDAYKDVTRG